MMSFDQLLQIAPPPPLPVDAGTPERWEAVEQSLGVVLPDDYKQLINCYGIGCFRDFLHPYTPFSNEFNLLIQTKIIIATYNDGKADAPQYSPPFSTFPQPGGLLPWARTDNGNSLFWLTEGTANHWPVVVLDSKFSEVYDVFAMSATDFIFGWLSETIDPTVFPDVTLFREFSLFQPYQPKRAK